MADEPILRLDGISKSFGPVKALRDVSLSFAPGEIHAVLGENGAGKSTLVKIITGELGPDAGTLSFAGSRIPPGDPLAAAAAGITMVHQELTVFEDLTVAENIFPDAGFRTRLGLIDRRRMREQSAEKLALFDLRIDPAERIVNLPLAEQRIVEILRAIGLKRRLVILDEPTAGLNESETRILISLVRQLRQEGITIIYISHRISEVMEISDRISILRDGAYIATVRPSEASPAEVIRLMVGREVDVLYAKKAPGTVPPGEALLELEGVGKQGFLRGVSLAVHRGEILGVYGLQGSGVEKLSQILYGLDAGDTGNIRVTGEAVRRLTADGMLRRGFSYLNDNRKRAGLFLDMSTAENMACPSLDRLARGGILNRESVFRYAEGYIKRFNIIIPGARTRPRNLSGGNQQKLMFSVCLGTEPQCVILNEPTRGIDVGAKAEIHRFILELPGSGRGVILFTSDLPELLSLADRVIVMRTGSVAGELTGDSIEEERIMALAAGG
jgi:ABC-type sugar transport system ATPase subunit